jgi:hypothetical protein
MALKCDKGIGIVQRYIVQKRPVFVVNTFRLVRTALHVMELPTQPLVIQAFLRLFLIQHTFESPPVIETKIVSLRLLRPFQKL